MGGSDEAAQITISHTDGGLTSRSSKQKRSGKASRRSEIAGRLLRGWPSLHWRVRVSAILCPGAVVKGPILQGHSGTMEPQAHKARSHSRAARSHDSAPARFHQL